MEKHFPRRPIKLEVTGNHDWRHQDGRSLVTLKRRLSIVARKVKMAGRSFSCPTSSTSFPPLTALGHLVHVERASVVQAYWKARSVCWRPGVQRRALFSSWVTIAAPFHPSRSRDAVAAHGAGPAGLHAGPTVDWRIPEAQERAVRRPLRPLRPLHRRCPLEALAERAAVSVCRPLPLHSLAYQSQLTHAKALSPRNKAVSS